MLYSIRSEGKKHFCISAVGPRVCPNDFTHIASVNGCYKVVNASGGRWCPEVKEASAEFLSMPSRRAEHDVAADITVGPMSAGLLRRAGVGQPVQY